MAKHLSDRDIGRIVELLDGWQDKLGWDELCKACGPVIGTIPVRQTLYRIVRIRNAYHAVKERLKGSDGEVKVPSSMRAAAERIARLEHENERLKRENSQLLQQFVCWQYNAHVRGMSDVDLNKPLPAIDRGMT